VKYVWIGQHRDLFPVTLMCHLLQVSRSGYYSWVDRPPSARAVRREKIQATVARLYIESNEIYSSTKIARQMRQDEQLESACRNTVAKAMREMGLKSRVSRGFTPITTMSDPTKQPAANVLNREFTADAPNQKWVTDITYLKVAVGWVYLAAVVDLFSRKVVGWAISDSLATSLVSDALRDAVEKRRPQRGELLHHSDRGCQYTSEAYQRTLNTLGIQCSMSRTGNCYDNAVAERFFWSLKYEWTNHYEYENLEEARLSVFKYIETFYNSERLHQTLGYQSPNDYEAEHAPVVAA
jgi:putative transposase